MNGWILVCGSYERLTNPLGKGRFVAGLTGNKHARQVLEVPRAARKTEACLEKLAREFPDLVLLSCQFRSSFHFTGLKTARL